MPKITIDKLADLQARVGQEVAVSDWLEITQQRIDQFAAAMLAEGAGAGVGATGTTGGAAGTLGGGAAGVSGATVAAGSSLPLSSLRSSSPTLGRHSPFRSRAPRALAHSARPSSTFYIP